ncbi:MAG TPA: hypothetical protein VMF69_16735 [Gemmataceae bacterium]|nr:hypothetical protein [Gemmataceae bacterium]
MDTEPLVDNQIDEGQRLLDLLGEEGVAVRAACWVKPIDKDRWMLYIATPIWEEKGPLEAYRQLTHAHRSLENAWLTGSDVTLVGEKHPLVKDALEILKRFPHWTKVKPPRPLFGGIPVEDEVYVYPLGKVKVTIYGMTFREEPSRCLHLSFEPYTFKIALVEERNGQRNEYPAETGIDWVVAAPEGATLERDEFGQLVLAWNRNGTRRRFRPNEVWSFAKLGLHGFRFLSQPSRNESVP